MIFFRLSICLLLLISNQVLFAQAPKDILSKPKKESLLDILVTQKLPKVTLEMDLKALFNDRRRMNYHKAVASITFDDGEIWADNVQVRTRGRYRNQMCDNPPLKLKYKKRTLKARGLNKNNELKLVYSCNTGKDYEKYVLKEYLVYKLNNVLTDQSLRVQLINLEIKDSLDNLDQIETKGFLIEHREEIIDRLGADDSDVECVKPVHLSTYDYTLFQVFQYFIGNTDWLLTTCKNCEIISLENGEMVPVPYDFDFSGMVNTKYATPKSNLPVRTITDRYFLGHKKKMSDLEPVFVLFQEKKSELIQTINDFEYLSKNEKKRMVKYLESFYKILEKPKLVKREFVHPMSDSMKEDY